ncbi:hypothetical protein H4R26_002265 [Coemansia thaxteri]|uniref:Major facilitator superfamily (MFS) profile domain-containing protein n=1 Tax=Coemansia thaxteri TaxID=2663907 RepID=A0A9W8BKV3_9FUNG|nr:hypothetical protein H4R26_002265 [Coemansia thaxteri]KAJ2486510.1 hypothetical protein EV174_001080 [Coemansia sp. RSA 2320]
MAIVSLDILMVISALDTTIVATVYVPIGESFSSTGSAEWIITSYLITVTAFQPLYGRVSDLAGRTETIVFAVSVFLLGSILCALSTSMNMLIASRAIQGIGGAGLMSMVSIVIADITNERQRSKYTGIFTSTYGVASAIAPVLGGAIVNSVKWQVVFWINVPCCLVALVMILLLLRIPRPKGSAKAKLMRIDMAGALLCLAGVVLLLLGLAWGGRDYGWSSAPVVCTLVFGFVLLLIFIIYESMVPAAPIVPVRLFRIRNFAASSIASLLFGFAINGPMLLIPQWAIVVKHASAVTAGEYLISYCFGLVLASAACGWAINKAGRCCEFIIAGSALLLLGNCLLLDLTSQSSVPQIVGFLLIGGLGVGCCMQPISLVGQASVSGRDMASSTTTFMFFRSLGMIVSVSALSNAVQNSLRKQLSDIAAQFPSRANLIQDIAQNASLLYSANVPADLQALVIEAYSKSIHTAFIVLAAFTAANFLAALGFKHVELKSVLKRTIDV